MCVFLLLVACFCHSEISSLNCHKTVDIYNSKLIRLIRDKMPARSSVTGEMSNSNVRYSKLASDDDGYIDLQVRNEFYLLLVT